MESSFSSSSSQTRRRNHPPKPVYLSCVLLLAQVAFVAPFVMASSSKPSTMSSSSSSSAVVSSSSTTSTPTTPTISSTTTTTTSSTSVLQLYPTTTSSSSSTPMNNHHDEDDENDGDYKTNKRSRILRKLSRLKMSSSSSSSSSSSTVSTSTSTSTSKLKKSVRTMFSKLTKKKNNHNHHHNNHDPPTTHPNKDWKGGEEKASWISKLLFQYASPLVNAASERTLTMDDAFVVPSKRKMGSVVPELSTIYQHETRKARKHHKKVNTSQSFLLLKSLWIHQKQMFLVTGLLRLLNTTVQAFPAILISRLLKYIEAGTAFPATKALEATGMLVAVLLLKMMTENQYFHGITHMATMVRGSVAGLIFDKSLHVSSSSSSSSSAPDKKKTTTTAASVGEVLNLMQTDTSTLEFTTMQLHTLWDGPLQIAIYTTLLFKYLGKSVFYGIAVLLLTIPLNSVTLRLLNRLSKRELEAKDQRTKRTTEAIRHMKLLKLHGWEHTFQDSIQLYRTQELQRHVERGIVRALNQAVSNAVPALTLVVTLTAYSQSGHPLVASTIFTAISLFNQLRFPLFFYPMLIDSLANGKNALRRISSYLSTEEITPYIQQLPAVPMIDDQEEDDTTTSSNSSNSGGSITMRNGNFLWSSSKSKDKQSNGGQTTTTTTSSTATPSIPALSNINLDIQPGEVVAVIGSVGAGKTALIKSLLGELTPVPRIVVDQSSEALEMVELPSSSSSPPSTQGGGGGGGSSLPSGIMDKPQVITHGHTAYCSQEAWLPKGTIRDAVVFGRDYNETRYMTALRDAGLDADIVHPNNNDSEMEEESTSSGSSSDTTTTTTTKGEGSTNSNNNPNSKAAASSGVLSHDTDVGEGGSSLSGGQRARVALARALYDSDTTSKVYLLDDPLAALDASVGATVFERMTKRLRADHAATVLVTNDPSLPRQCDKVILMGPCNHHSTKNEESTTTTTTCSTILDVGTYDELLARGHDIRTIQHDEEDELHPPLQDEPHVSKVPTTAENNKSYPTNDYGKSKGMVEQPDIRNYHESQLQLDDDDDDDVDDDEDSNDDIQVIGVGGYAIPSNDTILTCHADPDSQACKDLERFPDNVADHAEVVSPDTPSMEDVIHIQKTKKKQLSSNGIMERQAKQAHDDVSEESSSSVSTTKPNEKKKLISADDVMSSGAVPWSTYKTYLKSVRKPMLIVAMMASYLFATGAQFFQQFIVAKWTEIGTGDAMAAALGLKYLRSLIHAAGVVSVFLWLRSFLTMRVGTRASEFLHNQMLTSVFRAPMSFFDATPSGQLLSRFGKEMETVDRSLPDGIGSVLYCFLQIGLSGLALAGVITPAMALPLGVIGVLYFNTMSRFRPAARDLKREESKSRSPIYTHFGEALRGTEIIRSIPSAKTNWSSEHRRLTDSNLSVFASVKALDRWLSLRLESLGNVVVLVSAVASVILTRMNRLKAGSAGWGLTQALAITGLLTWAVRTLTDLETYMMSVMRVKELTALDAEDEKGGSRIKEMDQVSMEEAGGMPHELSAAGEALAVLYQNATALNMAVAPSTDKALVRDGWPWKGGIAFKQVSMRYNAISPLVLNNVTIHVPPGTTLGVVGRTGSGKSSLLVTLFRIVEIEKDSGSIEIDGVDIRSVSLQTLRESLSIIPQDPVLFAGTIMYNLDATGKASEEDAWSALEAASPELATQFRNNGKGLNTQVSEGGKNLSSGQRQLLCLARALLRKSKILVLDEATSSVDSKTDAQVQATIQKEFVQKGVTVITVAHRLDTILGYDKIAVLGNGKLAEYGTPNELLQNRAGELRRLVDADRQNKLKGSSSSGSSRETTSETPPPMVMA